MNRPLHVCVRFLYIARANIFKMVHKFCHGCVDVCQSNKNPIYWVLVLIMSFWAHHECWRANIQFARIRMVTPIEPELFMIVLYRYENGKLMVDRKTRARVWNLFSTTSIDFPKWKTLNRANSASNFLHQNWPLSKIYT